MFCRNCGKEVADKAEICVSCGVKPLNGDKYCQNCSAEVNPNAEICIKCGLIIKTTSITITFQYAGFWKRFVAAFIDGLIWFIPSIVFHKVFSYFGGWLTGLITSWLYYALMESSTRQATLGKQALGIIVTDMQGNRISFNQATGRYFAKLISGFILCIGYIMAGFTEKKQALHDIIANCLVVSKT